MLTRTSSPELPARLHHLIGLIASERSRLAMHRATVDLRAVASERLAHGAPVDDVAHWLHELLDVATAAGQARAPDSRSLESVLR